MNGDQLSKYLNEFPIVAAVKNEALLEQALNSDCKVIFLLYGAACTIGHIVDKVKKAGKFAFVHMDLVDGLSSKDGAVDFIKQYTSADGIISTKANQIKRAKKMGLLTIQRFFAIDSKAIDNIGNQLALEAVDMIEVLPGAMPKILEIIIKKVGVPLIAGGLICDKADAISAISAGAIAISSTKPEVWLCKLDTFLFLSVS